MQWFDITVTRLDGSTFETAITERDVQAGNAVVVEKEEDIAIECKIGKWQEATQAKKERSISNGMGRQKN